VTNAPYTRVVLRGTTACLIRVVSEGQPGRERGGGGEGTRVAVFVETANGLTSDGELPAGNRRFAESIADTSLRFR